MDIDKAEVIIAYLGANFPTYRADAGTNEVFKKQFAIFELEKVICAIDQYINNANSAYAPSISEIKHIIKCNIQAQKQRERGIPRVEKSFIPPEKVQEQVNKLREQYPTLFSEELGEEIEE